MNINSFNQSAARNIGFKANIDDLSFSHPQKEHVSISGYPIENRVDEYKEKYGDDVTAKASGETFRIGEKALIIDNGKEQTGEIVALGKAIWKKNGVYANDVIIRDSQGKLSEFNVGNIYTEKNIHNSIHALRQLLPKFNS